MFVRDQMTRHPITVASTTPLFEAQALLKKGGFRRLPVVVDDRLVGIVTDRDFKEAAPSDATSLSIYELSYLLNRLSVEKVMHTDVITVRPSDSLEEAATLMKVHKISGLPVVKGTEVVGILTITDVLRGLLALLSQNASQYAPDVSKVSS